MVTACDVLIVGAGPTGLTAANLCARLGLSAVVVERRESTVRAPAAHVVNARTFEIWRQTGLDLGPILDATLDPSEAGTVHWVTKLGGEVIGSLPYERQGPEMLDISPTPLRNLSQHRLEPLLLGDHLDARYGHSFASAVDTAAGVLATVTGPDGDYLISARYLLGADGAASSVRRIAGIEMVGARTLQSNVMIHIAADFRALVGDHLGVLSWVVDPAAGGTFISHGADREWVYNLPWDPEGHPFEWFDDERCRELVCAGLADPSVEFDVLGVSTWHMSAQVAERYRAGNTFLVGDAAHRFPPTGGLGLNTGVADVHNLIWKIAGVEAGWLHAATLDTYEAERRPVAVFNSEQSLHNALRLVEIPAAFGYGNGVEPTTDAMYAALADPSTRASVEAAIANQAIHFDLLGLQLGHSYEGSLVIADGTPAETPAEPARDYWPSTRPGGRLPHCWLDASSSTLDLVDPGVPTVLVCAGAEAPAPRAAAPYVVETVPVDVWTQIPGLVPERCLVVRPDQHVAYRGNLSGVASALTRLFG
ncbi:MAG: FAD-dependent monooxygenase [Actinomycetota bacterium]